MTTIIVYFLVSVLILALSILLIIKLLEGFKTVKPKTYPSKDILENNEKIRSSAIDRIVEDPRHKDKSFYRLL